MGIVHRLDQRCWHGKIVFLLRHNQLSTCFETPSGFNNIIFALWQTRNGSIDYASIELPLKPQLTSTNNSLCKPVRLFHSRKGYQAFHSCSTLSTWYELKTTFFKSYEWTTWGMASSHKLSTRESYKRYFSCRQYSTILKHFHDTCGTYGRRVGLMVSVMDFGFDGPGSSHCQGIKLRLLGKALCYHSAFLFPGI